MDSRLTITESVAESANSTIELDDSKFHKSKKKKKILWLILEHIFLSSACGYIDWRQNLKRALETTLGGTEC